MLSKKYKVPTVETISDEDYFGAYDQYVTAHKLISYSRDPVGFWDTKETVEHNENLIFGAAVHKLCLEGEKSFWAEYAVLEDNLALTKGGRFVGRGHKTWVTLCENLGKPVDKVLRASEFDRALSISDAFYESELSHWWRASDVEQTLRWQMSGLDCQGKADMLCRMQNVIIDLKTSSNAAGFDGSALRYGYDIQAAFYSEGYKRVFGFKPRFLFIVIEKDKPHVMREFEFDKFTAEQAHSDMLYWAERFAADLEARSEG